MSNRYLGGLLYAALYMLIMIVSWSRYSILLQNDESKPPITSTSVKGYSDEQTSRTTSKLVDNRMDEAVRKVPTPSLVIDIISVGSLSRMEYQETQRRTFASHKSVRFFFNATELDDYHPNCAEHLTAEGAMKVSRFCRYQKRWKERDQSLMRHWQTAYASPRWLRKKPSPHGWICAQNRPTMGFARAVEKYRTMMGGNLWKTDVLPDYLIIADDDTYMNLELVHQYLVNMSSPVYFHDHRRDGNFYDNITAMHTLSTAIHSPQGRRHQQHQPIVIAGCVIRSPVNIVNMTIPFGGFGFIMSKMAIFNYMRPIQCPKDHVLSTKRNDTALLSRQQGYHRNNSQNIYDASNADAAFVLGACDRIQRNLIEERDLFHNGMSLSDLQVVYVNDQPYTQVHQWYRGQCLHSDWLWGYFINTYKISQHTNNPRFATVPQERLEAYQPFGVGDVCKNEGTLCDATSHICHYQNSSRMEELMASAKRKYPERYR